PGDLTVDREFDRRRPDLAWPGLAESTLASPEPPAVDVRNLRGARVPQVRLGRGEVGEAVHRAPRLDATAVSRQVREERVGDRLRTAHGNGPAGRVGERG